MKKNKSQQLSKNKSIGCVPRIEGQLVRICDSVLELRTWHQDTHQALGWTACWFFVPFALPMTIGLAYGTSRNADNFDITGVFLFFILVPIFMFMFTLGYAAMNMRALKKNSYLRFNRQEQKVYALMHKEPYSAKWSEVKVLLSENMSINFDLAEFRDAIRFTLKPDRNNRKKKPIVVSVVGNIEIHEQEGLNDGGKQVWEFIRQFMTTGPNELQIFGESAVISENSYISLPPKDAWKKHTPFQVHRNSSKTLMGRITLAFVFLWRLVFFIPNVIAEFLWHGLYLLIPTPGKDFPKESLLGCEGCVTPSQMERVLKGDEESLNYQTAVDRLSLKT